MRRSPSSTWHKQISHTGYKISCKAHETNLTLKKRITCNSYENSETLLCAGWIYTEERKYKIWVSDVRKELGADSQWHAESSVSWCRPASALRLLADEMTGWERTDEMTRLMMIQTRVRVKNTEEKPTLTARTTVQLSCEHTVPFILQSYNFYVIPSEL